MVTGLGGPGTKLLFVKNCVDNLSNIISYKKSGVVLPLCMGSSQSLDKMPALSTTDTIL